MPADGPTDEAANGALTERQPAAAVAQRWARSAGSAVPDGVAGAVAAKDAAAGHEGPYGGHEGSLLGPSAPLPVSPPSAPSLQAASHGPEAADAVASSHTGPPPLAAARQQQQQQLQPSPFAAAADAVDLAAAAAPAGHCLHPVHSITDDSPFARMPPLGSGSDEDEDSGGTLRGLRSKPSRLGAISEGRHSGSGSSSSNSGPASSALQQGDAVELAADFSQLLSIQRSTSGEAVLVSVVGRWAVAAGPCLVAWPQCCWLPGPRQSGFSLPGPLPGPSHVRCPTWRSPPCSLTSITNVAAAPGREPAVLLQPWA